MAAYSVKKSLLVPPKPHGKGMSQAAYRWAVVGPEQRVVATYDDRVGANGRKLRHSRFYREARDAAKQKAKALNGRHQVIAEGQQKAREQGTAVVRPRGQALMRITYRT